MIENEDLDAEDFIPDSETETEEVDIHELLFSELTELLGSSKSEDPSITSWLIGERLRRTLGIINDEKKAKQAFDGLQQQIAAKFGAEYTSQKLYECLKLADEFPDLGIFSEYTEFLSLDHFLQILTIDSDMARTFYCEMCRQQKWNVEELTKQIKAHAFEKEYEEE